MSFVSLLYKLARLSRDLEVITSGKPKKIARRGKNKLMGRYLIRKLWRLP